MCALSGWLHTAPLISLLETNENTHQWDVVSFLGKKSVYNFFSLSVVSGTIRDLILISGVKKTEVDGGTSPLLGHKGV